MNVLIVDDSRVFRSIVKECIDCIDSVAVIGSVWNGEKAIEFITKNQVDVVTLDIEMPTLNGIETLHRLKEMKKAGKIQNVPKIIMLSSLTGDGTDATITALELGAFDFIQKGSPNHSDQISHLRKQFTKVFKAIEKGMKQHTQTTILSNSVLPSKKNNSSTTIAEYIVIGVSTGGPKALVAMLPTLSKSVRCPILIVQHMPPLFTDSLAKNLNKICDHTVIESKGNEEVVGNNIFIAPGGKHLVIRKVGQRIMTSLNVQPPESGCRPSVDVLFRSASTTIGNKCLAIILTGMGVDGTAGLRSLKRSGATIFVQDEKTSVVWGMPGSAVETGLVDKVIPLLDIPTEVKNLMKGA